MTEVPIVLHYYYFFFFSWMLMRRWDQSRESGFSFFFRLVSLFFFFYTQTQYSWTKIITIIIYNNRSKRLGFYSKVCVFITTFELIERANKKSHETWYLSSLSFSPFTFYIHFFFFPFFWISLPWNCYCRLFVRMLLHIRCSLLLVASSSTSYKLLFNKGTVRQRQWKSYPKTNQYTNQQWKKLSIRHRFECLFFFLVCFLGLGQRNLLQILLKKKNYKTRYDGSFPV